MRKICFVVYLFLGLFITGRAYAQSEQPASQSGLQLPSASPAPTYPQVKGYLSFIIPWVTVQGKVTMPEFKAATTIGFPFGVMVLYSPTFGFSFEVTPSLMYEHQTGKSPASKTSNVLFGP